MSEQQQSASDARRVDKMSHDRYLRTGRHRRSRFKIMALGLSLAVTLLVLVVVSIYSVGKISSLNGENMELGRSLLAAQKKIETLTPQLEKTNSELNDIIHKRFPNLRPLVINQMLEVQEGLIKQVVFTKIKQGSRQVYKYLVVAENAAVKKINPSFRLLLFDEFGVHMGSADVVDQQVLQPGESRDYTDEFELLFESTPQHFYIEDLSALYKTGNS